VRIQRLNLGFTLIEIAIVLLIVTILLGYTVAMFPIQQELKQYRQVDSELNEIIDQLVGFAQINGRLPCPDTSTDADTSGNTIDGLEDTFAVDTDCEAFYAFLPAKTLGMDGDYNAAGNLLDPWGQPYRYAVSESDDGADGTIDFVTANEIRNEGIAAVSMAGTPPDLFICDDSTAAGNHTDCTPVAIGNLVVGNVAAVVISTGKDRNQVASNIQAENTDDFHDGTNNKVFIRTSRSDSAGAEYDDVVKWLSPNLLFTKMIEADQLP